MDNKKETKQFNKKLLLIFFVMLAIFATLLGSKVQAEGAEMQSTQQTSRPSSTVFTYEDLVNYYDILCCQLGGPLPGNGGVSFSYVDSTGVAHNHNMGLWDGTRELDRITTTDKNFNYGSSSKSHKTFPVYTLKEHHIATPKEAYIIAEMKKESSGGQIVEVDGSSSYGTSQYNGSFINSIEITLSTGEKAYLVDQEYVLDTGNGAYYVKVAKDSNNKIYYVYETDNNGKLVKYTGDFTYQQTGTGTAEELLGVYQDNVYYEFNGQLSNGNTVASDSGMLYLLSYNVVKQDPTDQNYYYTYIENGSDYIQKAWWTTGAGNWGNQSDKIGAPNSLSLEADEFQNYILNVAGVSDVSKLKYEVQSYDFYEDDGTHSVGSVTAPVISYHAGFNEDADQNGEINEADEVTPSFDSNTQKYIVGPFSLDYIKESAHVSGRAKVDFAGIKDVKLVSNLGELKLGEQWNFKFLVDQARDLDENYPYPNPNEVFYIEINYIEDLTFIENFEFSFQYMNAGAELDVYDGNLCKLTWTPTEGNVKTEWVEPEYKIDENGDFVLDQNGNKIVTRSGYNRFVSKDVWLQCTNVEIIDAQTLAHALIGARWYNEVNCDKKFGLNSGTITIEKRTLTEDGSEVIPVDKEYQFKILIDGKEFQELTVKTENGYGKAISIPYVWTDENKVPTYEVVELGDNKNNGPWTGTLENHKSITVSADNYIGPNKGKLEVDKKLLNSTPALEDEIFTFKVSVTGKFSYYNGEIQTYSSEKPLQLNFAIKGEGTWTSEDFRWYGDAPKYTVEEIIDENATYELVNGVISNGIGQLKKDETVVATATNQPTTNYTKIYVDKRMVSSTKPMPGEVFKATLTINGNFSYNGDEIVKDRKETFDIVLDENNNWQWQSDRIAWNKDEVPTYTISETQMAEGTTFVSISDEVLSSTVNDFSSKLNPEKTNIVITNSRENPLVGKLKIQKMAETKDLAGKTFRFRVKITDTNTSDLGGFKYQDVINLTDSSYNYTKRNRFNNCKSRRKY